MTTLRVFPRRTKYVPAHCHVWIGDAPLGGFVEQMFPHVTEVHVSCTFSWDVERCKEIAASWSRYLPTRLGGPAIPATRPEGFTPGMYLRRGYTITSRGCPNRCSHCLVWFREGPLREIEPIPEGWNVFDNNLLACSPGHIERVIEMLSKQRRYAVFSGGLEAARVTPAIVQKIMRLNIAKSGIWLAWDQPRQREPVLEAGRLFQKAGLEFQKLRCYVLAAASPDDSPYQAWKRCKLLYEHGIIPFLMLYQPPDNTGKQLAYSRVWRDIRRHWTRPALMLHNPEEE